MTRPSPGDTLHRLTNAYRSFMRSAFTEAGIELPITHLRALKGVRKQERCTAQYIAQRMHRDKAQITRVLKELQAEGLITKVDNPDDRRSQLLRLTAGGEAMLDRLRAVEALATDRMTRHMEPDDVESFIRLANQMADNLQDTTTGDSTHG